MSKLNINFMSNEKFDTLESVFENDLYAVKYEINETDSSNISLPLFYHTWSDHLFNDVSYLRADTFSWQSGEIYTSAYNELKEQYNNSNSVEETEEGITYKRTPYGYKIALASQEEAIKNLYDSVGVAWFYIIDLDNKKFKLPRTKFGFVGVRDAVGKYVAESLPDHTHHIATYNANGSASGGGYIPATSMDAGSVIVNSGTNGESGNGNWSDRAGTGYNTSRNQMSDASTSSNVYKDNAPVQQKATQMYLYFYVGNYIRNITEIEVGKLNELVNDFDMSYYSDQVNALKQTGINELNTAVETSTITITQTKEDAINDVNKAVSTATSQLNNTRDSGINALANASNALRETQVTNIIKEIPQDIKLELNDGVLTLKAGSKVYVPNGFESDGVTPVFDEVIIESDISIEAESTTDTNERTLAVNVTRMNYNALYYAESGTGYTGTGTVMYYDTAKNLVERYTDGELQNYRLSLPIARVKADGSVYYGSISQVFNGFGYIGSTLFALPGVRYIAPNGRNVDGSLNNSNFIITSVITKTLTTTTSNVDFILQNNNMYNGNVTVVKSINDIPSTGTKDYYVIDTNQMIWASNGVLTTVKNRIVAGKISTSSGTITSLQPKLPFRAVDHNDLDKELETVNSNLSTLNSNTSNLSLSNINSTGKQNMQLWVGANYTSSTAISTGTTLSKHGYIYWRGSSSGGWIKINGLTLGTSGNYCDQPFANIRVSKGDVVTFGNTSTCVLYSLKG